MSVVSGVTLQTSLSEKKADDEIPPQIARINAWLTSRGKGELCEVSGHYGGRKHPQVLVFGGGFSCLDEDEFAKLVMAEKWEEPENVVLLINPEDGPTQIFQPETK